MSKRRREGGGKKGGGRNRKRDGKKMKERKVFWVKRVGAEDSRPVRGREFWMTEGKIKDGACAAGRRDL